jgi:trans-aconitate 2-methyltransferase
MTKEKLPHVWKAEEYHQHSSAQESAASQLLQSIAWKGYERVLDVGCGDGKISAKIANCIPNGSVLGIDISQEMINFAQRFFTKTPNLAFLLQDAQQLNYFEEFDVIFSSFALQWLQDPTSFFLSAYRSLKSSGYLAATIPLGISSALEEAISTIVSLSEWSSYFKTISLKWHFITDDQYRELLIKHQFIPIKFATVLQTVIFSSREHFEKYVIQWFAYLHVLPQHLKQIFFKQIIDKYLEIEPVFSTGEVSFKFLRVDMIASKSIFNFKKRDP